MILALTLGGCSAPQWVDRGKGEEPSGLWPNEVVFRLDDSWRAAPPTCIAVLPLAGPAEAVVPVRRMLFAHLAPQGKRDIELARIDHLVARLQREDRAALGAALSCDALLEGEVTENRADNLGVFSRLTIGARLRLVRAADGLTLWEGEHVASSHGGALPLSPLALAWGLVDAADNLGDEQRLRLTDDLARRLAATIPDDVSAPLDDPAVSPGLPPAAAGTSAEALAAAGDYAGALAAVNGNAAADHFFRGRMLLKLGRPVEAEPVMLRAVAMDGGNSMYLNGLAHAETLLGRPERALAAYRMAIEADAGNAFAWYNTAILLADSDRATDAAEAFLHAGRAYVVRGDLGMAAKSLAEAKALASLADDRVIPLEQAITSKEKTL